MSAFHFRLERILGLAHARRMAEGHVLAEAVRALAEREALLVHAQCEYAALVAQLAQETGAVPVAEWAMARVFQEQLRSRCEELGRAVESARRGRDEAAARYQQLLAEERALQILRTHRWAEWQKRELRAEQSAIDESGRWRSSSGWGG